MTRGEKNCNPGNIERNATKWRGMAPNQTDARFVVYTDPVDGIRAIGIVVLSYYRRHKLKTVRGIINRWAPPVENDSNSYVTAVCKQCSVDPDDTIKVDNPDALESLIRAIIHHENGRVIYSDDQIRKSVEMALA